MKKVWFALTILAMFSVSALGSDPPVVIEKGEVFIAPARGVFLGIEEFQQVVKALEEVKLLRMKINMLESIDRVMEARVKVYKEAYEEVEKLVPQEHWWNSKLLWFFMGIATSRLLMTEDSK